MFPVECTFSKVKELKNFKGEIVCAMYPSKLSCNITLYLSPLLPCMIKRQLSVEPSPILDA